MRLFARYKFGFNMWVNDVMSVGTGSCRIDKCWLCN